MGIESLITVILVLAILGFALWLLSFMGLWHGHLGTR
jgi:hypothetical protein